MVVVENCGAAGRTRLRYQCELDPVSRSTKSHVYLPVCHKLCKDACCANPILSEGCDRLWLKPATDTTEVCPEHLESVLHGVRFTLVKKKKKLDGLNTRASSIDASRESKVSRQYP